jgi:penicillin-binding protein 1C
VTRSKLLRCLRLAVLGGGFFFLALLGLAVTAVEAASYVVDLPPELAQREQSLRLLDRHGELLREVRSGREARSRWQSLDGMSPHVVAATLAAEDRRFWDHGGVDAIAAGRAIVQDVLSAEVVSGASTLTMQLARILRGGGRTWANKFIEAALARKIERTLDKRRILEEYLNRAPYGNDIVGIEAAAWGYFRKSARDLSLGEAATLAALPRSPKLYDPYKHRDNLRARRDRILDRMLRSGSITQAGLRRAAAEPLDIHPPLRRFEAPHFVQWVLSERASLSSPAPNPTPNPTPTPASDSGTVVTTLDLELQRRVETLVERTVRELEPRGGRDAAVIVLDNRTGEVLAYVGSADYFDPEAGQVDGVRARRQPGSALKPLTYALAFSSGYSPASLLPDIPARYPTGEGEWYAPRNYDNRFHGPVRAREALANSYNVPAVYLASLFTPEKLLETYHAFGLTMLDQPAGYYGVAITLGDGEVTLLALANAYATLARDGILLPVRAVREGAGEGSSSFVVRSSSPESRIPNPESWVLPSPVAWLVTDVLADRRARLAAFGEGNVLELPFRVAAKTGTSKNYRDNWTMGYTRELTVGVWVGNFSGEPMGSVSGITGAGPLFRDVMLAAMEGRPDEEWPEPTGLQRVRICALSGELAGSDCPLTLDEYVPQAALARQPLGTCRYHRRLAIDTRNGLLAGPGCPPESVEQRVFESYPGGFLAWAHDARRPLAPTADSPLCPGSPTSSPSPSPNPSPLGGSTTTTTTQKVTLVYPPDGARFSLDPDVPPQLQTIALQARVADGTTADRVEFLVDGRTIGAAPAPFRRIWKLEPGRHEVTVRLGTASDVATIDVR